VLLALKTGYRGHPIAVGAESHEPLVDVREYGVHGENFYASNRNPPHFRAIPGSVPQLWVREGVARRLEAVNRRLAEHGLALWLFDGWRPNAVQAYFYDNWMPSLLKKLYPDWSAEKLETEVQNYWSAPTIDTKTPAPHLTGAAVDLSICWADTNERLWMGSLFDDASAVSNLDHFEHDQSKEILTISDDEARTNRRLLYWTMREAGFAANPTEWWHYSFGDQMWARLTGEDSAFYGAAEPPH
jgi:D-alanyl-D-alanine dipeptidase